MDNKTRETKYGYKTSYEYWFNILVGKKELKESILNNLEYRKANLK